MPQAPWHVAVADAAIRPRGRTDAADAVVPMLAKRPVADGRGHIGAHSEPFLSAARRQVGGPGLGPHDGHDFGTARDDIGPDGFESAAAARY